MEITLSPLSTSVNKTFYHSLFDLKDGERVRMCLQCGTCSGVCPFGYIMKFPPRKIIGALGAEIFGHVLKADSVWMCVSCNACSAFCPSNIPITEALMTRTKAELLLSSNVPAELPAALENTQRYGNPMGESPRKRADWTAGIQPEVNILGKTRQPVDVLWYVGDYASYHSRIEFDVTRERIRQIEVKAMRKLKHPARSRWLRTFMESP